MYRKDRPSDFIAHEDQAHHNDYYDRQEDFLYLPVYSGRRNIFFMGEMLEEQVGKSTWTIADLVDRPTKLDIRSAT